MHFYNTLVHRGKILEEAIRKRFGNNVSNVAKKLGYERSTIYRHFSDPDLGDSTILKYSKALKYDFSEEFPELFQYASGLVEPLIEYKALTVSDALKEADMWKDKYLKVLEKYNDLLEKKSPNEEAENGNK